MCSTSRGATLPISVWHRLLPHRRCYTLISLRCWGGAQAYFEGGRCHPVPPPRHAPASAPWVLSSAGKLIRYLQRSYFLPFVPQTFSSFVFYSPSLSFCLSVRLFTERSLLHIMSRHAPYWWLATSLFWYSARLSFLKRFWKITYPTFNEKKINKWSIRLQPNKIEKKVKVVWILSECTVYLCCYST